MLKRYFFHFMCKLYELGSSVGIVTGYGLDGPGIKSRWGPVFSTCSDRLWGPPILLYNGYWVFPGVKSGRSVTLTPQPLIVPWSWKVRAIPLLPLWAVRVVQSLSACTRVHFTVWTGLRRSITKIFLSVLKYSGSHFEHFTCIYSEGHWFHGIKLHDITWYKSAVSFYLCRKKAGISFPARLNTPSKARECKWHKAYGRGDVCI